jgi:glycosyltransferase (activator-dependent family)
MRVLFASYSDKTHFLGMVPLAWALRTAGHEVRVATQPEMVDTVTGAGLTAVPVGKDHSLWRIQERFMRRKAARWPEARQERVPEEHLPPFQLADVRDTELTWERVRNGYVEGMMIYRSVNEPMLAELVDFCQAWQPDLVIWEPMTYAAPIAAKVCGAAHARLLWSMDAFGRVRYHFRRLRDARPHERGADPLGEWMSTQAGKYGAEFSEEMTCGQFTIDQYPPSMRLESDLHIVPMRYVPYNYAAVVPKWLWEAPKRPRIVLTLGVSTTERFGGYAIGLQGLLDSLSDLDIEIVATVADEARQNLSRVPENTRLVSFVPLHAVVPHCSVMVSHVGFGTVNTTALYGVPQIALPEDADAPLVARSLERSGAGLTIPMNETTGTRVREYVVRLLEDPKFTEGAARLREEMLAMPAPNELVPELERLTTKYRYSTT